MKKSIKLIAFFLGLVMLASISLFNTMPVDASENSVGQAIDNYVMPILGKDMGGSSYTYYKNGRSYAYQCHAFVNEVWHNVFNYDVYDSACYQTAKSYDFSGLSTYILNNARIGDIIRFNNTLENTKYMHSLLIRDITSNGITVYEYGGARHSYSDGPVKETYTWSQLSSRWNGGGSCYFFLYKLYDYAYQANSQPPAPITYTDITPDNYFIKNKASGTYLNVGYSEDADLARVHLYEFGNYDAQVYNVYKVSDGYEMMPLCSSTRVVNPYCDTVQSGKTVNLYHKTNESSQWWKFQKSGDGYIIRNVQNPNVCLANASADNVTVEAYTGADNQIWYLEKACTIKYDANGGSGAPASQRVRAGYEIALSAEKPTRKCHTFKGWSTSKTATIGSWNANSFVTVNKDTTLYAVWADNHSYGNWQTIKDADCMVSGERTRTCTCGVSQTEAIPALGHAYSTQYIVDKAATCTESGSKSKHCSRCSKVTDVTAIPATGHSFGAWKTTKNATCVLSGEKTRMCAVCASNEKETVAAIGHDYSNSWTVDKAATCTENGSKSKHCSRCSSVIDETAIASLGHNFGEWVVTKAATADTAGAAKRTCSRNGCSSAETKTLAKLSADGHTHTYTEWRTSLEATCSKAGEEERSCTVCSQKETRTIANKGHTFGAWIVTLEPTQLAQGKKEKRCESCTTVEVMTIDALPQSTTMSETPRPTTTHKIPASVTTGKVPQPTTMGETPRPITTHKIPASVTIDETSTSTTVDEIPQSTTAEAMPSSVTPSETTRSIAEDSTNTVIDGSSETTRTELTQAVMNEKEPITFPLTVLIVVIAVAATAICATIVIAIFVVKKRKI